MNEGRNRGSSSQLDINQSVQSGISTPRPDSGFVDREEIEVIEIYIFSYKYKECIIIRYESTH